MFPRSLSLFLAVTSAGGLSAAPKATAVAPRTAAVAPRKAAVAPRTAVVAPKARVIAPRGALAYARLGILDTPEIEVAPESLRFLTLAPGVGAPKVELAIEPEEGENLIYSQVAGWTAQGQATAQLSVLLYVRNKETKPITLQRVTFAYGNTSKPVAADLTIQPGERRSWQNGRPYHEIGDVVYFEGGIPASVTLKLHFAGFSAPVTLTRTLKPFGQTFGLPFKHSDLGGDEVWESASTHGGGAQVFAYDMGVEVPGKGAVHPGKDGKSNSDFRVWGKPIYAMADGVVKGFCNVVPNNPKPGEQAKWDVYTHGGAGNHFYIQHGNLIALYAHMQKGTLTASLLKEGATVKKGARLGLAGNSGSSGGPHLHIHVRKETEIEKGPYRPLVFKEGFVIAKSSYPQPGSSVHWNRLDGESIPGKAGNRSYLWPSLTHPSCGYPGNPGEISRHGIPAAQYQAEFDKATSCGMQVSWIDGYDVGGKTFFNVTFRPSAAPWAARHNLDGAQYQAEFTKWAKAGYRLIVVDSYLLGGKPRYAAVWEKSQGPAFTAYHGLSSAASGAKFQQLIKEGYIPTSISCVESGGQLLHTGLYEKKNVGGFYHLTGLTQATFQKHFDDYGKQGFKLVYVNGYSHGGPKLSAIWYKNTSFGSYVARHNLNGAAYQAAFNSQMAAGFKTRCVTGYQGDGGVRFAGLWVK